MKYQIIKEVELKQDLRLGQPTDVFKIIKPLINKNQNSLFVVLLDSICYLKEIHILELNKFYPELPHKIFNLAIAAKSKNVITVHSRASDNLNPTPGNIEVIEDLVMKGNLLKIEVLDHLIVSKDDYFSF